MKHIFSKLLTALLVLTLIFSLCACSETTGDTTSQSTTTTAAATTTTTAAAADTSHTVDTASTALTQTAGTW